jgi:hypothetical protein
MLASRVNQHFLDVPSPEVHSLDERGRVSLAVEDKVVQPVRLGHIGFDGKDGESHLGGQKLEHAVLELEELACAVRGLAKCYNPCVAYHLGEWLHVVEPVAGQGRCETNGTAANPFGNRIGRGSLRGLRGDRERQKASGENPGMEHERASFRGE